MKVTYPVTVSKYGSYKQYHSNMVKVKQFIELHWDRLIKNFQVNNSIEIRLRPLPNRRTRGSHRKVKGGDHLIVLDISKQPRQIIQTLFHELTHAEQVEQGRLEHKYNGVMMRWEWVWKGFNHGRNKGFGQTSRQLDKYNNQPWEMEANARMEFELKQFEDEMGVIE